MIGKLVELRTLRFSISDKSLYIGKREIDKSK